MFPDRTNGLTVGRTTDTDFAEGIRVERAKGDKKRAAETTFWELPTCSTDCVRVLAKDRG
jgi:hypothetical protein